MRRFSDPRVASLFKSYPPAVRASLMELRDLCSTPPRGRQAWAG
ncbi:MAG TPA: hypothetical protein VE527_23110 [Reyranella sp.]|nr:hypothetical protein [Reyranella sp.]